MTTALDIIESALSLSNAVGVDQTLTADETSDCLARFNRMIDAWNAGGLAIYNSFNETFSTVAGTGGYSIGPTGTWVTTRPQSISSPAICTYSGVDYPVLPMTQEEYNYISLKSQQQPIVLRFLYVNSIGDGIIVLWPVPSEVVLMSFNFQTIVAGPVSASSSVAFPPGYEDAFEYNLAVRLAPIFGKSAPPDVQKMAVESLATIKRANRTPAVARFDSTLVPQGGVSWQRGW